jgi:anti-anti-sigma factor
MRRVQVVTATGDLNQVGLAALDQVVGPLPRPAGASVVLDLGRSRRVSSAALVYMVRLGMSLDEQRGALVLAQVCPEIARRLEALHLDRVLPVLPTVGAAVAWLQANRRHQ